MPENGLELNFSIFIILEMRNQLNKVNIIKAVCAIIAVILTAQFIDYFISLLVYSHDVWGHEALAARLSLSFISNGLRFSNPDSYPYILTMYGFLYELACVPLFFILGPTINCGRIMSFISTLLIIVLIFSILRKKGADIYFASMLSLLIILFKPTAAYLSFSKVDTFAALLTLPVLYSLYFHKGRTKFFVTLIFCSLALMTKQTTIFVVPVVLASFYIEKKNLKSFLKNSFIWLSSLFVIFLILFLSIPNYFYNTFVLTRNLATLYTSFRHLLFDQVLPLIRATVFLLFALLYILIKRKVKVSEIMPPSFFYILFYLPLFVWTSYNTGSEVVYYIFIFIGLAIFLGEVIIKYELQRNIVFNLFILCQLLILLIYPSKYDFLKFTYYFKPSQEEIIQASEIDDLIRKHGIEKSYATFIRGSFGLSAESANNYFGMFHAYLLESGKLNTQPIVKDLKERKFSIFINSLDYPGLNDALVQNYYLYKFVGDIPIYLPRE